MIMKICLTQHLLCISAVKAVSNALSDQINPNNFSIMSVQFCESFMSSVRGASIITKLNILSRRRLNVYFIILLMLYHYIFYFLRYRVLKKSRFAGPNLPNVFPTENKAEFFIY